MTTDPKWLTFVCVFVLDIAEVKVASAPAVAAGIIYVDLECPIAGLQSEVNCGNGLLSFKTSGFFHDGLEPVDTLETEWSHRSGYLVQRSTQFYTCPVRPAHTHNHSIPSNRLHVSHVRYISYNRMPSPAT
jgi:hypothetical protein